MAPARIPTKRERTGETNCANYGARDRPDDTHPEFRFGVGRFPFNLSYAAQRE